jgi:mannose-1-phosphate guanylyltransferase
MMPPRLAMVLAGGGGLRFWPMSRADRPKQLLRLAGGSSSSMVAETVKRLDPYMPPDRIFCVTGRRYVEAIRKELPMLPPENIIDEPIGRDTAAAVAVFAAFAEWRSAGGSFCVLPADQMIDPPEKLHAALDRAFDAAESSSAPVTFGIPAAEPSTQFGYLRKGEAFGEGVWRVGRFHEKPDPGTAKRLVEEGWFWNSGMFVWKAAVILERIERHLPEHFEAVRTLAGSFGTSRTPAEMERAYSRMPKISIDYGVMEKTEDALMVPADFNWSDVGSWSALGSIRPADPDGNVVDATWSGVDTRDCILIGEKGRIIATVGCEDLVVVQTPDATLVAPKGRLDSLKALVEKLRKEGHEAFL